MFNEVRCRTAMSNVFGYLTKAKDQAVSGKVYLTVEELDKLRSIIHDADPEGIEPYLYDRERNGESR